jgi:hypothetical protein
MSKLSNLSRGAWIVAGIIAALVLVPSVAVATTSTLVRIEGASGVKANVTGGDQLLTTEASPGKVWSVSTDFSNNAASTAQSMVLPNPPSGQFPVLTGLQISVFYDADYSNPGSGTGVYVAVFSSPCGTCSQVELTDVAPSGGDQNTFVPIAPGQPAAGAALSVQPSSQGNPANWLEVSVTASGYFTSCADDPAAC